MPQRGHDHCPLPWSVSFFWHVRVSMTSGHASYTMLRFAAPASMDSVLMVASTCACVRCVCASIVCVCACVCAYARQRPRSRARCTAPRAHSAAHSR